MKKFSFLQKITILSSLIFTVNAGAGASYTYLTLKAQNTYKLTLKATHLSSEEIVFCASITNQNQLIESFRKCDYIEIDSYEQYFTCTNNKSSVNIFITLRGEHKSASWQKEDGSYVEFTE